MTSEISTQAALTVICSSLIEALKRTKYFPLITAETDKLNFIVGGIVAGIAAFGVHLTYDRATGVLTVTGLTLATVGNFVYDWAIQWAMQHGYYHAAIKKSAM